MKPIRIICVDDDPLALDQIKAVLSKIDISLQGEFYGSPKQAIEAHRSEPAELVISDLRMGATTGIKVISEMQEFAPETFYMLLSGEADLQSALTAMNETRVFRFFTKPAVISEIEFGVSEAIREMNLRKMRLIASSTLDAIERMNTAIVTVCLEGKIIYANGPAETLLQDSGAFALGCERELQSTSPGETKKFQTLLTDLATADQDGSLKSVFRFSREEDQNPVVVSVVYFEATSDQEAHFSLLLSDTARTDIATAAGITTALNLTPSEGRIVHGLVVGGSVDEAAVIAGVSVSTARTYLKHVFQKTGVSRQAELVRLALLSAA